MEKNVSSVARIEQNERIDNSVHFSSFQFVVQSEFSSVQFALYAR